MAYDTRNSMGGLAHIMLPGKSLDGNGQSDNKYAVNAISNLLLKMQELGASEEDIEICLAGGANVLERENDTIAQNVCKSVLQIVKEKKLKIKIKSLGGTLRRNVSLHISSRKVYLSVGDENQKLFCAFD